MKSVYRAKTQTSKEGTLTDLASDCGQLFTERRTFEVGTSEEGTTGICIDIFN